MISSFISKIEKRIKYQKVGIMKKWKRVSYLRAKYKCPKQIYVSQIKINPIVRIDNWEALDGESMHCLIIFATPYRLMMARKVRIIE